MLGLTASAAVYFLIVSFALQGRTWAIAVSVAIAAVLLAFLFYAVTFLVGWALAVVEKEMRKPPEAQSPFASSSPPPQIIPPEGPL